MPSSPVYAKCNTWLPARYTLREILYQSAQGTLYRLTDHETHSDVVLKCFSANQKGAYLREMAAAFGTYHPNICHCLDTFYAADGEACMVYEYIADGSLRDWLNIELRFPCEQVIECLRQLLHGLRYLHHKELIHCDLKPENILVKQHADNVIQYLINDLGAACYHREAQEKRHIVGSPAYVAPERVYTRFSYNSDLYSLGVLGFELACGERPFYGDGEQIYRAHLNQPPPLERITEPFLQAFLRLLLEKDPAKRIPSADDALHVLQQLKDKSDVTLPEVTQRQPSQAWPTVGLCEWSHLKQLVPAGRLILPACPTAGFSLLHVQGHPVAALHFARYTDLRVAPGRDVLHLIIHQGLLKVLEPDCVAYFNAGQICWMKMEDRRRHCLALEHCADLRGFALDGEYLLCVGERKGWLKRIGTEQEVVFPLENYWETPLVCLLTNGQFCCTGGLSNNEIARFNHQGEPQGTWTLDGPVMGWVGYRGALLILSLAMLGGKSGYSVWRLCPGELPRQQKLTADIAQWCFSAGQLLWTTTENILYSCNAELTICKLGQLPKKLANAGIAVTCDQRFFATLTVTDQVVALDIFQNNAA